ncbi:MAG TPA: hypothetical protein VE913_17760 [Longimicrobium sp.]|nr:hypothetical protein [Longimicrobium sp.]
MTRNFILAFGGTGARCLEAFTYLSASRAFDGGARVLVIDPDSHHGNVADALHQLQRYHAQHAALDDPPADTFFRAPLNAGRDASSFAWDYTGATESFATRLGMPAVAEHRDLLGLLYDDTDLAMSFEKGFVGRTHVGSLDVFRTLRRAFVNVRATMASDTAAERDTLGSFFRDLRNAGQEGEPARLLVFGSVFGGTGASGIPALPFLLNEILHDVRKNLTLACVPLTSYFSFGPPADPERDPDSTLHPLATQTALFHYAHGDTGYDRVYLLGAPHRRSTADGNEPGGHGQRNRSHYVELAAALAAADFFRAPPDGSPSVSTCGTRTVTWESLPLGTDLELRRHFIGLTTLCLFHARYLHPAVRAERHVGSEWQRSLARRTRGALDAGKESEGGKLHDFALRFLRWAGEVQHSVPGAEVLFRPGEPGDHTALGRVDGAERDGSLAYHQLYEGLNRAGRVEQNRPAGWYLAAASRAVGRFCETHYRNR